MDKLLTVYEELLDIYTCDRNPETVKYVLLKGKGGNTTTPFPSPKSHQSSFSYLLLLRDVTTTYDYLLSTYMALERSKPIRQRLGQLLQYVNSVSGHASLDAAVALRTGARILNELSNTNSPTRLCDLADAVRYYIAILRIASGYSATDQARVAPTLAVKEVRDTVETLLFNSRPVRREECSALVDKILGACSVDFLLDTAKSQNYFLKIVYPSFMAEDSLREKVL